MLLHWICSGDNTAIERCSKQTSDATVASNNFRATFAPILELFFVVAGPPASLFFSVSLHRNPTLLAGRASYTSSPFLPLRSSLARSATASRPSPAPMLTKPIFLVALLLMLHASLGCVPVFSAGWHRTASEDCALTLHSLIATKVRRAFGWSSTIGLASETLNLSTNRECLGIEGRRLPGRSTAGHAPHRKRRRSLTFDTVRRTLVATPKVDLSPLALLTTHCRSRSRSVKPERRRERTSGRRTRFRSRKTSTPSVTRIRSKDSRTVKLFLLCPGTSVVALRETD